MVKRRQYFIAIVRLFPPVNGVEATKQEQYFKVEPNA